MSVFVSTTYLGDSSSIQDAIDQLSEVGIKNIELGSNHAPVDVKDIKLQLNSVYIAHNYFAPQDANFVLNLASKNPKVRDKSANFMKNTIKICQKLNIRFYTIHPGFLGEAIVSKRRGMARNFDFKFKKNITSGTRQKILDRTIKIIKELYKYSRGYNVQLLVENEGSKTSKAFVIFAKPQELAMLKNGVGDSLNFNFNLAHATLADINLKDPRIFSHFYKDALFFEASEIQGIYDSHLPILSGHGRISALLKKYSKYFSKKNIILEYRNINIKEVKRSYDYVNRILYSSSTII